MCLTTECVNTYLNNLERNIADYMAIPVSQRSAEAVNSMVEAWEKVKGLQDMLTDRKEFTPEDAEKWTMNMKNSDGTIGRHWSMTETDSFKPDGIKSCEWNATMNMMYSDYFKVMQKYGMTSAQIFADMAEAFLKDEDANEGKLGIYYHNIVRK